MNICDVCGDKVKNQSDLTLLDRKVVTIPNIYDACKSCYKNITDHIDKNMIDPAKERSRLANEMVLQLQKRANK